MPGELDLIAWMRSRCAADSRLPVGIGDDCAVIGTGSGALLLTVDMLLESVHFDLARCTPYQVGRKALAVNLSDIAAVAGLPTVAVVAVGLPESGDSSLPTELFRGLCDLADEFNVTFAGGDTNRSASGLVVSVTLLGRPTGKGPVLRRGARPGDWLCVTGKLGYSLHGRHLEFTPRLHEAQRLCRDYPLTSMIDISDGLAADLFHLTDESRCGAILDASAIPIAAAGAPAPSDVLTPLQHALNDGEDFELLFTLPGAAAQRLVAEQPLRDLGVPVSAIGRITEPPDVLIRTADKTEPLRRGGFEHRW